MKIYVSSIIISFFIVVMVPIGSVFASGNPCLHYQTNDAGVTMVTCTWYAWQQVHDNLGEQYELPQALCKNACDWLSIAQSIGMVTGSEARAESVAVWSGGYYYDNVPVGHVAYVTSVQGDTMTINQGGVASSPDGQNGVRDVPCTVGSLWGNLKLEGFIYPKGNIPATVITLKDSEVTIYKGDTYQIKAEIIGAKNPVKWESSDNIIATVSQTGLVKGVSKGETEITIIADDVVEKCKIIVKNKPLSIKLTTPAKIRLNIGESYKIGIETTGENKNVLWTSSDKNIVTVTNSGTIKAQKKGTATVTAVMVANNKKKVSCEISVFKPSLKISQTSLMMEIGTRYQIKATPSGARNDIVWFSSDTNIATVSDEGAVNAVGVGTAKIIAKSNGIKKICTVRVITPPVDIGSSIRFNNVYSLKMYSDTPNDIMLKASYSGVHYHAIWDLIVDGDALYHCDIPIDTYGAFYSAYYAQLDNNKYHEIVITVWEDESGGYAGGWIIRLYTKNKFRVYEYKKGNFQGDIYDTYTNFKSCKNGKVIYEVETPFRNYYFGNYIIDDYVILSGNTFSLKKKDYYKLQPLTGTKFYNGCYQLNRDVKIYEKPSKNSKSKTLVAGTYFRALYIKPVSKKNGYWNLFINAETINGQKGWIYLPAPEKANPTYEEYRADRNKYIVQTLQIGP